MMTIYFKGLELAGLFKTILRVGFAQALLILSFVGQLHVVAFAQSIDSVPNNSVLPSTSVLPSGHIERLGYSYPGDGGFAVYSYTSSACTAADNGAQVTSDLGGCWIADFSSAFPTPMVWGASGNSINDDTAAVQAAINALQNRRLYLGKYIYRLNGSVTSSGPIAIIGSGGGQGLYNGTCLAGLRRGSASTSMIVLNGSGSLVDSICVDVAGDVTPSVNDTGIKIVEAINNVRIVASQINQQCIGIDVSGLNSNKTLDNINTEYNKAFA